MERRETSRAEGVGRIGLVRHGINLRFDHDRIGVEPGTDDVELRELHFDGVRVADQCQLDRQLGSALPYIDVAYLGYDVAADVLDGEPGGRSALVVVVRQLDGE